MDKLVYLFELDSVRNSLEEIEIGLQAIFEEIVRNGNSVVLSFNQLVDSHAFIAAVKDKRAYPHILELFRIGALRVSHYDEIRTPSQYLQDAVEKCKMEDADTFIFSAIPLMSSQKDLLEKILVALRYSDPAILTEMLEEKQRQLKEISECASEALCKEIDALDFLDRYVRMILFLSTESLSANKSLKTKKKSFVEYMDDVITHYSQSGDEIIGKAVKLLKAVRFEIFAQKEGSMIINNRSNWIVELYKRGKSNSVYMGQAIIDLCYNYTVEESIYGVSRHFDKGNHEQFLLDFDQRLKKYWKDFLDGVHVFYANENNRILQYGEKKMPHWITAVRLYRVHTKTEINTSALYESNFKSEKKRWKQKIFNNFMKTLGFSSIYIILLVIIDVVMDKVQDVVFNSDEMGILQSLVTSGVSSLMFGIIGSIISLVPWLPDFLEVFRKIAYCVLDVFRIRFSPCCKAYKNADFLGEES
ncbi:MAG: hypothetical protein ACI4QA_01295 [Candidatus Spyradosoma sp.]